MNVSCLIRRMLLISSILVFAGCGGGDNKNGSSSGEGFEEPTLFNVNLKDATLYYTSYSTGAHALKKVVGNTITSLLSNIEIYKLNEDPNSSLLLFNGLDFQDNQYIFGTFDPSASNPASTISSMGAFTGEVETVIVLP